MVVLVWSGMIYLPVTVFWFFFWGGRGLFVFVNKGNGFWLADVGKMAAAYGVLHR